jgi:hypothetical protein
MEHFHLREKLTHFDHERIPERVVHARGSGAHGYFQVYQSMAKYTKAKFLQDPAKKTPVFVRFSTVAGSRGSADTVRDVRGFATRFYTEDGNYDLVGNNIPVFFIQDAIKFPDVIHAVKPEQDNEVPQASSAHDTFWDFVVNTTETAHMVMWVLSDRALPRSFRMMDGFGVNTYRFVNEHGKSFFVKFHWRALLGAHALAWDETQKIAGKDPDFNRRDLWEAIDLGSYPEYEFSIQVIPDGEIAQILITKEDVVFEDRSINARNTFNSLFSCGVIPIVNENDTIATDEIKIGDNDMLSAHVARLIGADLLIILSDIDGLYDKDPALEGAELISRVYDIDEHIKKISKGSGSTLGTGGMTTKINAAKVTLDNNISMVIANGNNPDNIYKIIAGQDIGTLFLRKENING